jgi:hypothetical protein
VIVLPDDSAGSRAILNDALGRPGRITMILVATAAEGATIAPPARAAEAKNPSRQFLWVQQEALLTPEERRSFAADGQKAVCVLNARREPVKWLTREEAADPIELELAFLAGQQG